MPDPAFSRSLRNAGEGLLLCVLTSVQAFMYDTAAKQRMLAQSLGYTHSDLSLYMAILGLAGILLLWLSFVIIRLRQGSWTPGLRVLGQGGLACSVLHAGWFGYQTLLLILQQQRSVADLSLVLLLLLPLWLYRRLLAVER